MTEESVWKVCGRCAEGVKTEVYIDLLVWKVTTEVYIGLLVWKVCGRCMEVR